MNNGTVVSKTCVWCLLSREELESMEGMTRRDMKGTWRAGKDTVIWGQSVAG